MEFEWSGFRLNVGITALPLFYLIFCIMSMHISPFDNVRIIKYNVCKQFGEKKTKQTQRGVEISSRQPV